MVHENNIVRRERFKFQTDDCERLIVLLRADQMCGHKSRIENCDKWEVMSDWTWTHIWFRTGVDISACICKAPPAEGDSGPMDLSEFDSQRQIINTRSQL